MDQFTTSRMCPSYGAVACADPAMLPAACCALLSVHDNLKNLKVRLFLLAIDADERQIADIENFARLHAIKIEVLRDSAPDAGCASLGRWSRATLARLYLDLNIPAGIDRLLYIDADAVAVSDVDSLFTTELKGRPLGAVDDYRMPFREKMDRRQSKIGMRRGARYFNAGVLLFDWRMCVERGLLKNARDAFEAQPELFEAHDQDALNLAFADNWLPLDLRWNAQTGILPLIAKPGIRHFTGRRKPWSASVPWPHHAMKSFYAARLAGTGWSGFCLPSSGISEAGSFILDCLTKLTSRSKAMTVRRYFTTVSFDLTEGELSATPGEAPPISVGEPAVGDPDIRDRVRGPELVAGPEHEN
jgi:lipopolysaccharide biosynthesis glycosyltransferase